ncbi:MAG: toprim domain-containing protein [Acutalibacteraceae bacterium]
MLAIREAVVVEGRYDKIKLSSLVDTVIVETNGFSIYKDAEKRAFIKKLAAERGVVILTDSDNAGRQIRSYVASWLPAEQVRHAYIPDIYGKERRKAAPSKEGKLGVEGVPAEVLLEALRCTGVTVDAAAVPQAAPQLTAADLVSLGLSGGPNSAALRRKLLVSLGLPENLSTKMLLRWLDTDEKQNRMRAALKKIRPDA